MGIVGLPVETGQAGDKIEMLVAGEEGESTAGGLVFSGTMEGDCFAVDADRKTAVALSDRWSGLE
jgi:hypothetical protein